MQNYWCAARLIPGVRPSDPLPGRRRLYDLPPPATREPAVRGRKVEVRPPLFPGYIFILIVLQWHAAGGRPGLRTSSWTA